jgi:hypothetical protein
MLRNWKTLALCSLLAASVSLTPEPVAAQSLTKDLEALNKRLDQLEQKDQTRAQVLDRLQEDLKQLNEIRKDIAALGTRVKTVEDRKPVVAEGNGEDLRKELRLIDSALKKILELQDITQTDVAGIRKDVSSLKKDVTSLQNDQAAAKLRVDGLELALSRLVDDLKTMQKRLETPAAAPATVASASPAPGIDRALNDILNKLTSIEQAILRIPPPQPQGPSRAAYYAGAAPTNGGSGRVRLENFYGEDMLFIINGRETRVPPNQVVVLELPAGPLSYEVVSTYWGSRAQRTTTLAPNDTYRITAR